MAAKNIAAKCDKGAKNADKGGVCLVCDAAVKGKDLGVQCEVCDGWYHAKCVNIGEEGFKVLQMVNTHWYCDNCNEGIGKILICLSKLQKTQEKMEIEFVDLKKAQSESQISQKRVEKDLGNTKEEVEHQRQEIKTIQEEIKSI